MFFFHQEWTIPSSRGDPRAVHLVSTHAHRTLVLDSAAWFGIAFTGFPEFARIQKQLTLQLGNEVYHTTQQLVCG